MATVADLDFERDCWTVVDALYPGGSGKVPAFDLAGGVEFRSRTHCGGGGGGCDDLVAIFGVIEI